MEIIGIILSFLAIILMMRLRVNYGLSMIVGAILIGLFSGFSPFEYLAVVKNTFTDPITLKLLAIIALINVLGYTLGKTGQIDRALEAAGHLFSGRVVLGIIPSIFGLLPLPGGALMSAPVIEPKANALDLNPGEKTFINLWFRHIWFFIFPLGGALILASHLAEVNIYSLIASLFPTFFLAFILGIWYGLRPIEVREKKSKVNHIKELMKLLWNLSPIFLVIVLNVFGLEFYFGLIVGLLLVFVQNRVNWRQWPLICKDSFSKNLMIAIAGIMFFRHMINYSGIMNEILSFLQDIGIPSLLLFTSVPFVIGLTSGASSMAIGVVFPLLLPLLPQVTPMSVGLLFTLCQLGYLISPLHLCLVVTKEYFRSNLNQIYRKLLPPIGILFIYNLAWQVALLR
jgi:hypothetical protein